MDWKLVFMLLALGGVIAASDEPSTIVLVVVAIVSVAVVVVAALALGGVLVMQLTRLFTPTAAGASTGLLVGAALVALGVMAIAH